jgi:formate hydrogenlyase subunit 4
MSPVILQLAQVLTVLLGAPLLKGMINRLKANVQSKRGPSIWQPYFDLWKLFQKQSLVSEHASWIYRAAPILTFVTPLAVAMLIPVLTGYPLPYAFMGDMLAGGFILSLGGFFTTLAALDTASAFGGMGSSRARVVSLLAEPVVILVLFAVTLIAHSTIPFVVNQTLISPTYLLNPAHWLLAAALFMVILAESGRIPVDNPATTFELSMIESSRLIEYSGPELALMEWGGAMKFFVLLTILLNVLTAPWGLVPEGGASIGAVVTAVLSLLIKMFVVLLLIVGIESSLAKWRFFRIPEFLGAAFVLSALAVIAFYLTTTIAS